MQESLVAASLEFVRVEGQLQGVARSLHKLQSEIDSCVRGAQVSVCMVVVVACDVFVQL